MTTITAQTILRSRHSQRPDKVLSTLLLRYPRWIHAELMTHRVFSRNAASSRAIPIEKLMLDVRDNPAMPIHWGKNQKGMQANEELTGLSLEIARTMWQEAKANALLAAVAMSECGAHKQIVNRLLEPFMHITVLVSSTEWSNFLALRDHPDAEPHIAMLAREVRKELDQDDNIQSLEPGEWHMPFASEMDADDMILGYMYQGQRNGSISIPPKHGTYEDLQRKLSVARCASTSYKTVDGFDMTLEKAIEIHDKLVGSAPLHASPAEHVAQADGLVYMETTIEEYPGVERLGEHGKNWRNRELHGNFTGFRQYRKMLPNECL